MFGGCCLKIHSCQDHPQRHSLNIECLKFLSWSKGCQEVSELVEWMAEILRLRRVMLSYMELEKSQEQ